MLTRVEPTADAAAERDLAVARLDPAAGRMLQAVWLGCGAGQPGRLLLVVHHVVIDGVSLRVLAEDLQSAWTDVAAGRPIALAKPDTTFRQWSTEAARRRRTRRDSPPTRTSGCAPHTPPTHRSGTGRWTRHATPWPPKHGSPCG